MATTTRTDGLAELGLDAGAAIDEKAIRRAFLKQSLPKHPDKEGGSTEAFQALSNAYHRLTHNHRYPTPPSEREGHRSRKQASAPKSTPRDDKRKSPSSGKSGHSKSSRTSTPYDEGDDDESDDSDYGHWGAEYSSLFHRTWQAAKNRDDESEYEEDFCSWEAETRRERARQRRDNVRRGYDYRDKAAAKNGNRHSSNCMFCGKNRPISRTDALGHGLNWNEYNLVSKTITQYYPLYSTCWACKNSHKSVLTRKQATRKFTANKHTVLRSSEFAELKRMGRSFHHQPVTGYCEFTRNNEYFWYPDLEKAALKLGWKASRRKSEVPWVRKDIESQPRSASRQRTTTAKTPKRSRKDRPVAVTASVEKSEQKKGKLKRGRETASQNHAPVKRRLFAEENQADQEKISSDKEDDSYGDWRSSAAIDY